MANTLGPSPVLVQTCRMKLLKQRLMGLVEASPRVRPAGQDLRSWVFFVMLQVGITICVPVFLLGVQLGRHMAFPKMVLAVFVGASTLSRVPGAGICT